VQGKKRKEEELYLIENPDSVEDRDEVGYPVE
jgi:hypothetical protein